MLKVIAAVIKTASKFIIAAVAAVSVTLVAAHSDSIPLIDMSSVEVPDYILWVGLAGMVISSILGFSGIASYVKNGNFWGSFLVPLLVGVFTKGVMNTVKVHKSIRGMVVSSVVLLTECVVSFFLSPIGAIINMVLSIRTFYVEFSKSLDSFYTHRGMVNILGDKELFPGGS